MEDPPATWRSRLRRWRWWIAAIALIIGVRVALPIVLRAVIASQASSALHATVAVGDVDLALWKGGVALEDVEVYALQPEPHPGTGSAGGSTVPAKVLHDDTGGGQVAPRVMQEETGGVPLPARVQRDGTGGGYAPDAGVEPIVAFKRFAVELRYWPLFWKTIQLRDVALEGPQVALDRLASGDLNIMALVPKSEVAVAAGATPGAADAGATPTPTAGTAEAAASPWKLGLDRFVLRDGRLRFRDFAMAGSEPVEVGIDEVSVREIALNPGVYGEPARVNVKLGVDAGDIDVAARFELIDAGVAVTCDLTAQRLPLRRARLYVPKVGWSELKGELDLALTYALQSDAKNEVHGSIGLRDVAIAVSPIGQVAAWKSLNVEIDTVDLLAQRAAVESVALDGAEIYVRAQGGEPLPLLAKLSEPAAPAEAQPTPEARAQAQPSPPAEPPKPWEWRVANLRLSNSTVHVLSDQPPLDIGVDLTTTNLAGAADAIAHLALGLGLGPASVKVDGDLRIAAPAFGGTVKIEDLSLPPLVAASGAVDPALLPSATLKTDLAVEAGLPATTGGGAVEPNLLRVRGGIGLTDTRVAPPGGDLAVAVKGLDLTIDQLVVPGVIPVGQKADPEAAVHLAAKLDVQEPNVTRSGEQPLTAAAEAISLVLSDVSVPAALVGLAPTGAPQPIHAVAQLDLTAPRAGLDAAALSAEAQTIRLAVSDASIMAVPPGASASGATPARLVAQLDLSDPKVTVAGGEQLAAGAHAIGLQLSEVTLPGVTAGAPPADTGAPVHAVATLTLAQPRAVRGDGKQFSFTAKAVAVPLSELSVAGALAPPPGGAQTVRAAFGDIRIDAPVARLTRTKDGMVLPSAAPAPADGGDAPAVAAPAPTPAPAAAAPPAAASPALELTVDSLRVSDGDVDFTDHAVQPTFHDRYAPIDLDARNLSFPTLKVKPLRFELTSAEQGHITGSGEFGPRGGDFEMEMDHFPLTPFNPYATTYSPYGIGEGSLSLKTTVRRRGEKFVVSNAITLHQLDLTGAEGDSFFEKQFGVPLSMVLALLRDTAGDIDLNIPVEVDQSGGASVDLVAIVQTALRQALLGAIQSPLKLVGGVIGMGGKSGRITPSPIAFPLGRSEPTAAGAESVQRLATFLASRPGMAVRLDTSVTADDVRWLHEQSLRSQWADEGFFQRTFAFVTERGPRERIGAYLAARAEGEKSELSAEDAATLQQWLDERPPPTSEQLSALAAERIAAVESVLREKGIDAARISHGEPAGEPGEGAPVVRITFRPLRAAAQAGAQSPATTDTGQPTQEGQ